MISEKLLPVSARESGIEVGLPAYAITCVDTPPDGRGTRVVLMGKDRIRVRETEAEVKRRLARLLERPTREAA